MKVDINRYILSASISLCDIGEPRYRQNNTGYHVLRIGYLSIFDYLHSLITYIVLPYSQLPDVKQKTTCTENVDVAINVPAFNNVYILINP